MPRLLVISNNALSNNQSNGRTLMNFLGCFEPSELAQFYINGVPDANFCGHTFRVSDKEALFACVPFIKKRSSIRTEGEKGTLPNNESHSAHMPTRNCKNMVLRDAIWNSNKWWRKEFTSFLDEFAPEIILFQAGDCPFMYWIAIKIAKRYGIPLTMYNSESYVLKQKIYAGISDTDIWHQILKKRLAKAYCAIMKDVRYCFYITESLEDAFQQRYPHVGKSCALYTSSDLKPISDFSGDTFDVAYAGNLGVGRIEPLCSFAEVLLTAVPNAMLHIYGRFLSREDEMRMNSYSNVCSHGVVPYDDIPRIMSRASLIIHCENSDRLENLRYSFSTKIADNLASGRPFLVYADARYPFVEYLAKHNAAHIAGTKDELFVILQRCFADKDFLYSHVNNAVQLANENHSKEQNSKKFYSIVSQIVEES